MPEDMMKPRESYRPAQREEQQRPRSRWPAALARSVASISGMFASAGWLLVVLPRALGFATVVPCGPDTAFALFFFWRYLRTVVHAVAYLSYKPWPVAAQPRYSSGDVTVIIPSIDFGVIFQRCVESVCHNAPAKIIVVTVGPKARRRLESRVQRFRLRFGQVIEVLEIGEANKRRQVAFGLGRTETDVVVTVDATACWPASFLDSSLAPFEDGSIYMVGTNKRVMALEGPEAGYWQRVLNLVGRLYLERHNWDITASTSIDGGIFAVSGRTCLMRTEMLRRADFLPAYLEERFLKLGRRGRGLLGPLAADDDNFITRYAIEHGYGIAVQNAGPSSCIVTNLAEDGPKFRQQLQRWARTTWRSNPASLRQGAVWRTKLWSVYAVYLASFFQFALFSDLYSLHLLRRTSWYGRSPLPAAALLAGLVLGHKLVKVMPLVAREWRQRGPCWSLLLLLLPWQLVFTYAHSLLKLWALLTFWDVSWSGRDLAATDARSRPEPTTRLPAYRVRDARALDRVNAALGTVAHFPSLAQQMRLALLNKGMFV